jgi:DNA repair protein RecO (recombination protein O)
MPVVDTEAIVLKTYPLGDADKIVVFFTRAQGVVRGVARGAKRLKTRFGGGLEPFSEIQLSFFQKEERELVSVSAIELRSSCFGIASHPGFFNEFSYLAQALIELTPPHQANDALYRMVRLCLEVASAAPNRIYGISVYFKVWLLRLAGFMPSWSNCDACGRALPGSDNGNVSVLVDFHVRCRSCQKFRGGPVVTAAQLFLVRESQRLSPADFAQANLSKAEDLRLLSNILSGAIEHVAGRKVVKDTVLAMDQAASDRR